MSEVIEFGAERKRFDLMFETYELIGDLVAAVEGISAELTAMEQSRYRRAAERAFPRLFDAKIDAEVSILDRARFQARIEAFQLELMREVRDFAERKVAELHAEAGVV